MTSSAQRLGAEPDELLGRLGRYWGWALGFGVLTLLAGIAVLAWPGRTLLLIGFIVGAQLVIGGIFQFVRAFAARGMDGGSRVLLSVLAILSFLAGIVLLRHPFATVASLVLVVGLFWIVGGIVEAFYGVGERGLPGRGLVIATGVLSVLAGLVVLAFPIGSIITLALLLGIWLAVLGVGEIGAALALRRNSARTVVPPAAGPAPAA